MNLTIDIGNTYAKLAIFDKNKVITTKTDYNFFCIKDLQKIKTEYSEIKNVLILSVKNLEIDFINQIKETFPNVNFLDFKTKLDFKNTYKTPQTLGSDRIAGISGAKYLYPNQNVLVIDIGTAIKYDFITEQNNYIGGNISLGREMRFKALNTFTSKLPLINLEHIPSNTLFGETTDNAIYNGVIKGIIFEIDSYISILRKEHPNLKVILTGGDSLFFEKLLKNATITNKNLIFVGLNHIINSNHPLN